MTKKSRKFLIVNRPLTAYELELERVVRELRQELIELKRNHREEVLEV
jgi:hypothetical protein